MSLNDDYKMSLLEPISMQSNTFDKSLKKKRISFQNITGPIDLEVEIQHLMYNVI